MLGSNSDRDWDMLAIPKFFDSPSAARLAAKQALKEGRVVCAVNDMMTRVDPDEDKWFAIIVLDTDTPSTLLHARRQLAEFRVIGELFPETNRTQHARMHHA